MHTQPERSTSASENAGAAEAPGVDAQREARQWLPPARLRAYHASLVVGGALMACIFVGWMIIQWSNPWMRGVTAVLILATAWVTWKAVRTDQLRTRGRQLAVEGDVLSVTRGHETQRIALDAIDHGRWRDWQHDEPGLELCSREGQTLAVLDEGLLSDEREARAFLNWLNQQTGIRLKVQWH